MALTDEQMQDIQSRTKEASSTKQPGDTIKAGGQKYEVIATTGKDSTTQGIAVAPVDKNGNTDYSQTAIVVAGTQPPGDKNGNGLLPELGSTFKAFVQGEYGYSMQGKEVENLYQQTEENL
ncbi:hypothetical protein ACFOSE_03385, partial [Streptococcus dentapri]